jgi:ATP phosphoribosyltransferase
MLTIAVAKGRLTEQFANFLQKKGHQSWAYALYSAGRELVVETDGVRFLLVKGPDVPIYVERGIAPIGIVGEDILLEQNADVYNVQPFPFGKCYFAIAARKERDRSKPLRVIATKYPNVTKRYFATLQQDVECIPLHGSVELAAVMGLADGILDIVETGQTLRANGLEELQWIRSLQARCIVNKHAYFTQQEEIKFLLDTWRFEEVRTR